jgi:hypothetical protein
MSGPAPSEPPLRIEHAAASQIDNETVLISLSGRWTGPINEPAGDELLVVEVGGRRYRYAARSQGGEDPMAVEGPQPWTASFELPVWAEPRRAGQATLWVGTSVIVVPPVGAGPGPAQDSPAQVPQPDAHSGPQPRGLADLQPAASFSGPAPGREPPSRGPPLEDPRSGPLAELLLRETVSALRSELRERATELAQLRGALADARSQLDAGAATHVQMETTHAELRAELEQLIELVEQEGVRRAELERARDAERRESSQRLDDLERRAVELQQLVSERDAALEERAEELSALRRKQERELSGLHEQHERELAGVGQELAALRASAQRDIDARASLEHRARELSAGLAEAHAQLATATVSRDGALSEVTGLRVELDRLGGELAGAREQLGGRGGELGQARELLADARALAARLRDRRPDAEPHGPEPPP